MELFVALAAEEDAIRGLPSPLSGHQVMKGDQVRRNETAAEGAGGPVRRLSLQWLHGTGLR